VLSGSWPTVEVDQVQRLRVLAQATRGPMYAEGLVDAELDVVWSIVADLEHSLPKLIPDIRTFTVQDVAGEALTGLAVGTFGQRARFAVRLKPGWCLMQSRFVIGGMAAREEAAGTRFAVLAGVRVPGMAIAYPVLALFGRRLGSRVVGRLRALAENRSL
jgi:hypothetical protein